MPIESIMEDLIAWVFQGVLSMSVLYGVKKLGQMADSIEKLNTHVAILIERDQNKEKRLDDHEIRIRCLEKCVDTNDY